jgi:drug/metabolite transporter (DMT)-like permease
MSTGAARDTHKNLIIISASLLFVFLWSSGHITSKLGLPYIEPLTFLSIRFFLSALLLGLIALVMRAPWPSRPNQILHIIVAGSLMHAGYLSGVFISIDLGLNAGALAVITGIQPILTAVSVGPLLGENVTKRQWIGLLLGFLGVMFVMWEKTTIEGTPIAALVSACLCLAAITAGTIYQKRFCEIHDIRSLNAIQLFVSAMLCGSFALMFENMQIEWSNRMIFAMGWQVIILSAAAYSLFYWLLRKGEALRVTSLFYLMPPTTAIMGYVIFDETFGLIGICGLFVAMLGFSAIFHFRSSQNI